MPDLARVMPGLARVTYNIHVPPPEAAVVILPYLDENESQLLPHYSISIFSENNFFHHGGGGGVGFGLVNCYVLNFFFL